MPFLSVGRSATLGLLLWGALAIALVADSLLGLAWGWRPAGGFEHVGIALSFLPLATLLLIVWKPLFFRHAARELVLLLLSTLACLALLEVGAGYLNQQLVVGKVFHTRGPNIDAVIQADPKLLPGISGPAAYRTDRLGVRALEPRGGEIAWLAVGGSTTECVYLDDARTWASRTMAKVNGENTAGQLWLGNIGVSGYDTRQHQRMLEERVLLRGVSGLVFQTGINDLWRFAANEEEMVLRNRFEKGLKIRMLRAELEAPAPQPYRPVWARSRVASLLHTLQSLREPLVASAPEGKGGAEYITRRQARASAEKTADAPDWNRGAAEYGDRLRRLIQSAKQLGLNLVFTTQPIMWTGLPEEAEPMCWLGWREDGHYFSLASLAAGMHKYNEAMMRVCHEERVTCVDLSSLSGVSAYFYDDCHFTEAGAEAVAEIMAPVLAKMLPAGQQ